MRLVVMSDLHLDHVTRGVPRFDELRAAIDLVVGTAKREEADALVFLGDLCDPDAGPVVFRCVEAIVAVAQECMLRRIHLVAVAGNHDVVQGPELLTTLSPLRALERAETANGVFYVHLFERPGLLKLANHPHLVALPFTAPSFAYDPEAEASRLVGGQTDSIVLSHLSVPGIVPGEETTEMPRGREVTFPLAATSRAKFRLQGHYHRRQVFDPKDGGPPVQVVGSLAPLTFGEEGNVPGFLVVDTEAR